MRSANELSSSPDSIPWTKQDTSTVLLLGLFFLIFNGFGVGAIQFFRHTEADRTLIGWEMLLRGDYLIPHILGSVILTKPPLFYWLIAGAIAITGTPAEWAVRLPSVFAASFLIMAHYCSLRFLSLGRTFALLSAIVLGTSIFFLTLAAVAEIDMVFGLFCTVSLYTLLLALQRQSFPLLLLSYFAAALAFLTKGPPIVIFFASLLVPYYLYLTYRRLSRPPLGWMIWSNLFGVLLFAVMVVSWLTLTANQVGWDALYRAFHVEIFERAFAPTKYEKGPFFYALSLIEGTAPWSILALLSWGFFLWEYRRSRTSAVTRLSALDLPQAFLALNLLVVFVAVLMHSFSTGKTPRYIFPIYAFFVNILTVGLFLVAGTALERWIRSAARLLAILGAVIFSGIPFFLALPGASPTSLYFSSAVFLLALLFLFLAARADSLTRLVVALVAVLVAYRVGERTAYTEHRNFTRSVLSDVQKIDDLIPKGAPIYTIEMFERWVPYYLMRAGRHVTRVTPRTVKELTTGRLYLLLSEQDEVWRRTQLARHDPTLRELAQYRTGATELYLLEISASALSHVAPLEWIPTVPSEPYYPDKPNN